MHRWPSVTVESIGEVTFTIGLSWTWRSTAQPTPQYGQIVEVTVWADSSQVPASRMSCSRLEHQRAGRADADAVAAVDAGGIGQRHVPLRGDPGIEAAPGDGDRERVLGVLAARLDALVAEDALRVVADVEVVVDLHRLRDGRGGGLVAGRVVVAGLAVVALVRGGAARPAARSGRVGAVALVVARGIAVGLGGPASDRSTDEPRNSSTTFREMLDALDSVWTSMPASTLREQAGARTRAPSTSTTQTRQTFTGVRFSR